MDIQARQALKSEIELGLKMHTASQTSYRHWTRKFVYTEGVAWLAEHAKAFWLIDLMGSYWDHPKVKVEAFVLWKLTVNPDRSAIAVAGDGDGNELVRQEIPFTDFPLDEISFYFTDKTLLLPMEY